LPEMVVISVQFLQPIRARRDTRDWPEEPPVPAGLLFGVPSSGNRE
jgi:hypothetical protein